MSSRTLNPMQEYTPLLVETSRRANPTPRDFWDQYFQMQDFVAQVDAAGEFRCSVQVVNHSTGEQFELDKVRLSPASMSRN